MTNETNNPTKRQGIQVLSRAASILRLLHESSTPTSLGNISKEINLPRSTVQRIVDALAKEGFVIAGSPATGVRLGPAFLSMAESAHFSVIDMARPILETLAIETNESVVLTTLSKNRVKTLDNIQGSNRLVSVLETGSILPLHCSASGKAMLALRGIRDAKSLLKNKELTNYTKNTITSVDKLCKELESIQQTGIAMDYEEHSYGICSTAVATKTITGSLIALGITVPTVRFNDTKDKFAELLKTHANNLSSLV